VEKINVFHIFDNEFKERRFELVMNEPFALITYNEINVLQILSVHSLEINI